MADLRPIPTPWSQRWRRVRYRIVPLLVFGSVSALTFWLWQQQAGFANTVGEVASFQQYEIAAPASGILVADGVPAWELFDDVDANVIVARLDASLLEKQKATQEAQIARLEARIVEEEARFRQGLAEVELDRADREYEGLVDARRLTNDIQNLSLSIMDREALIAADQVEYERQDERFREIEKLTEKGVETRWAYWNAKLRRDMIAERLKVSRQARAEAQKQLKDARDRKDTILKKHESLPRLELADLEAVTGPFLADIGVQKAQIEELNTQIKAMAVASPVKGVISRIDCRPGQAVVAGQPILAITAIQEKPYIISYIRESQGVRPTMNMPVTIKVRSRPIRKAWGTITRIGPNVEPVPRHHVTDPRAREWGWPVRIELTRCEEGFSPHPGELVDVTLYLVR